MHRKMGPFSNTSRMLAVLACNDDDASQVQGKTARSGGRRYSALALPFKRKRTGAIHVGRTASCAPAGWSPRTMNRQETFVKRIGSIFTTGGATRALILAAAGLGGALASTHAGAESDRDYCERQQGSAKVVCMRQLEKAEKQPAASTTASAQTESDRAYCERQQGGARVVCMRQLDKAAAAPKVASPPSALDNHAAAETTTSATSAKPNAALYKVVDGFHVDAGTLKGFKVWRSAACDRCHGANQEGLVGPSLIESLKTLSKDAFIETVTKGRLQKGMPSFGTNDDLTSNIDHLYAYLKGRSDGAISQSRVEPIR